MWKVREAEPANPAYQAWQRDHCNSEGPQRPPPRHGRATLSSALSSYWPQTHPLDVPKKLLQIQTTVQAPNSSKRAECAKGAIPIPCSDTLPLKPLWEGSRPIASIAKGEIHTPCR
jgi:hypothetical protein